MRRSTAWRTLISISLTLSLTANVTSLSGHAATSPPLPSAHSAHDTLSLAEVQRLSKNADQRVIVILRDPYRGLPNKGMTRAARAAAIATSQSPIVGELAQLHAPGVQAYRLINAVAATVSTAEAQRLKANSLVQAVVPDRLIRAPHHAREGASPPTAPAPDSVLPPCTLSATLEPEALQLTNTAFADSTTPQAQSIVSGTGVTVAFLADGLDITNPDFIRPDGTPVFVDYQDFTGDGPNAPTSGDEAFGDASSIAAQGNETYDVNAWVTPAHRRSVACPQIKILGMAPGASLMGLKVIGQAGVGYASQIVQAIQYAVSHGANVINESFGANAYPDNANDPISLANAAATAAGITVVASTGDAGTASTIGSPATDPNVISVGATTQFRFYQQLGLSGFQLSNGQYTSNNISALSSAGPSQLGNQTVDVVAPGDQSWEVCTPNTDLYAACSDANGKPARFTSFGGTSEAAPLTAGAAALVIQAYRQTHGGASPSPALVKQIIMNSATDLNTPSYEQGAGLINSLAAVRLAASYHDANGGPAAVAGAGLLVSPNVLAATAAPNTPQTFSV
ncbi:MAG TPA: S8 family serine peptidase, partial [Chloroflexota bacterium]|nr:S8 family serine peptidase [Chloroflexota bacterium]